MDWFIGCSGFHYKHWRGLFYPERLPQKKWFEFYCEHFKTLELNVTFYRFPRLPVLQGWYHAAPADFRFSVKAPKAITHYKQFHNCADMLGSFYDTINNGLLEKLGPVLFQMAPRFTFKEEKLARIINSLDPLFLNVLEFRHPSWWREDVYQELSKHNISFCGMSHPELPQDVIVNTPVVYYRFHGVPDLYRSPYSSAGLQTVVNNIGSNVKARQAWCYFNNDIDVSAIANAQEMITLTRQIENPTHPVNN